MKNLLTWNYWFNLRPEILIPIAQKLFIAFIIFLLLATIIIALTKNKGGVYHGFLNRLYLFFWSNTLIALLLFFIDYEMVPFFSARFWLGLWIIGMLIWLIFIFNKLKNIPKEKELREKEKEYKKYLP